MRTDKVSHDPLAIALSALAWTVSDGERATRLLALTGLAPEDLRQRAADPAVLGAVLGFLEAHQPDLIACADAIDVRPDTLVSVRMELER